MQYHLRYDLGLSWAPVTAEAAFALVQRESYRELFRALTIPSISAQATTHAQNVLRLGLTIFNQAFPKAPAIARRGEFTLAVSQFLADVYVQGRDRAIGYDIPTTIEVKSGEDTILVEGAIDFAFWQMVGQPTESAVALTIVELEDPLEDLVNFDSLRAGFAVVGIRNGTGRDIVTQHRTFPAFNRTTRPTLRQRADAFERIVRAIDRGIQNRVFIPQASPEKCEHCPFKPVCHPSLVDETSPTAISHQVPNPFEGWPKRNA